MSKPQRYMVKKHRGKRTRGVVSLTLSSDEVDMLDAVAAHRGVTRSALVGQLARSAFHGFERFAPKKEARK